MSKAFMRMRDFFTWNKNFNYSESAIVKWASYGYFAVPLIAYFIDESQNSPVLASHFRMSELTRLILSNLYFSSLLIILASFLVRIFCPERIKKYPAVEDYFRATLDLRTMISTQQKKKFGLGLKEDQGDQADAGNGEDTTQKILEKIVIQEVIANISYPNTIYQEWSTDNHSKAVLRWLIGIFNVLGTLGIFAYMIWSALSRNHIIFSTLHIGGFTLGN